MFLGLMIKHHRVQINPVAVRAAFWVRESFSTGRYMSEMPARTIDHFQFVSLCPYSIRMVLSIEGSVETKGASFSSSLLQKIGDVVYHSRDNKTGASTFITGALKYIN